MIIPTPNAISTTPNMVETVAGNTLATMVKLDDRKAELPNASMILMTKEEAIKVLASGILFRNPKTTHIVPVVRIPPLNAVLIPIWKINDRN